MTTTTTGRCVFCSHLFRATQAVSSVTLDDAPALKCRSCGYDLSGLLASRCPECGSILENNRKRTKHINGPELREELIRSLIILAGGVFLVVMLCATRVSPLQRLGIESAMFLVFGALASLCMLCVDRWLCADDTPRSLLVARTYAAYGYVRFMAFMFLHPRMWISPFVALLLPVALLVGVSMVLWLWEDQSLRDALTRGVVITMFASGPPALVLAVI